MTEQQQRPSLTGTMPRTPRTQSMLALPDADEYPVGPLVVLLCGIAMTEGADGALFPSVTFALTKESPPVSIDTIGNMAVVQLIVQAFAGPAWGIVASRNLWSRKSILVFGTFFQGLATLIMWYFIQYPWIMYFLRAINGACLAALRPIANSIVGDRFDDQARGKYFGFIMSSLQFGQTVCAFAATVYAPEPVWGDFKGWKLAFIVVGLFTMSLAPGCFFFLKAPPVIAKEDKGQGLAGELSSLMRLFQKRSFVILVFQGCFGLIPWRAFDFRAFFFRVAGLKPYETATVGLFGGVGATVGSMAGGQIGDAFNACWPMHGRVLGAEVSVYGGIPLAYLSFMVSPPGGDQTILTLQPGPATLYYLIVTMSLGLIATWPPSACNSPVLCSLAAEDERALILSWQTSLEGAIGALGPIIFTNLLRGVFEFDERCSDDKFYEKNRFCNSDSNLRKAGLSLFCTSCVPWTICGLMYSTLHLTYPADLEKTRQEAEAEAGGLGAELTNNA